MNVGSCFLGWFGKLCLLCLLGAISCSQTGTRSSDEPYTPYALAPLDWLWAISRAVESEGEHVLLVRARAEEEPRRARCSCLEMTGSCPSDGEDAVLATLQIEDVILGRGVEVGSTVSVVELVGRFEHEEERPFVQEFERLFRATGVYALERRTCRGFRLARRSCGPGGTVGPESFEIMAAIWPGDAEPLAPADEAEVRTLVQLRQSTIFPALCPEAMMIYRDTLGRELPAGWESCDGPMVDAARAHCRSTPVTFGPDAGTLLDSSP